MAHAIIDKGGKKLKAADLKKRESEEKAKQKELAAQAKDRAS